MQLKKSYKGLIIWIVFFFVVSTGVCFLPIEDTDIMTRAVLNICTFAIALLTFIIYKTEYVYWYTGMTFEAAQQAGSKRRKIFAMKHFKRFGLFALVFFICSISFHLLNISIWGDILLASVGMIATAISTVPIKL